MRASVLAAIGQVRPLPPLPEQGRGGDVVEAAPDAAAAVPDDELARRRQARLTRLLTGLAAAAVVVALALGGWAVSLQQRVAEVTAQEQLVTEVLTAPDATVVPVQLPDGSRAAYTVSREQDRAVFAAERLPETEPGKVYQLWTMHVDETGAPEPGTVRPGDTFTGGEQVRVVFGAVRDTEALAITVEDAPGSQTPTTEPFGFAQV
nr:anti-sigma factor [Auraticoccus cholistanensis]